MLQRALPPLRKIKKAAVGDGLLIIPLDEFSAPRSAVDGLTMKKPNGSPWIIVSVLPGCPADQVGLQAGDEITRVNGAPVAAMSLNQLIDVLGQAAKSITLTVQRTGRAAPLSVKLVAPAQKTIP